MHSRPSVPIGLIAVLLGLITLVPAASIDMYLPFMPTMTQDLGTDYSSMQLTLMVFLISMGLGQLFFGPLIDAVGRRIPLLVALGVFIVASLLANVSQSLDILIIARVLQGLAAATAMVTAMSTVRDVSEGAKAAQLFALLMTIQGLGPVLMPAVGGTIGSVFGWRSVFVSLAILGTFVFLSSLFGLRETLPTSARTPFRLGSILRSYGEIMRDKSFLLAGLALSSVFFFIFAYVGGAAHVYQSTFGLSAQSFGYVFGATGVAVFIGAMVSAKFVTKVRVENIAFGSTVLILTGAIVALSGLSEAIGLPGIIAGMFLSLAGLGAAEATLMSIALETRRTAIGTSAALLGAFPLCVGALATPVSGIFAQSSPSAWIMMLIASGFISMLLAAASRHMVTKTGLIVSLQH